MVSFVLKPFPLVHTRIENLKDCIEFFHTNTLEIEVIETFVRLSGIVLAKILNIESLINRIPLKKDENLFTVAFKLLQKIIH